MIAVDVVKRIILQVNRFGLYLSVPAFLLIAYAYTSSVYPQYRVTAKIALKNADPESAIRDIKSKLLVQKALGNLMEGRTVVVIAHRLSTVRRADRIVVLARGAISEVGTHEALVTGGGIYQRLHEMQFVDVGP